MKQKVSSYRTKGHKMTQAQKLARGKTRSKVTFKSSLDADLKGIGKYSKKAEKPLSRKQAYRLEKMALQTQRAQVATKPEVIKAFGQAFALNTAPASTSYAATAGTSKLLDSTQKQNESTVGSLITGGAKQATTNNEEEEVANVQPGGYDVR